MIIRYVNAPVARKQWHHLRVEFESLHIKAVRDGRVYIDVQDGHFAGPGCAGVWTKADSMTAFEDFTYGQQ
jgi:hypothetical protein